MARLRDMVELNRSKWDPSDKSSILYLDLTAVVAPGRLSPPKRIAASDAPSRARRRVQSGDILVSTVRPNLRGFARVRHAPDNLIASTGFAVLTPLDNVDDSFVYQHVMTAQFARYLASATTGQAYPAVRPGDVAAYVLPVPPVAEQRAIATVLDAIDEAIERTEVVLNATERLRDALLHELLSRGVPGWHTEWRYIASLGTIPAKWSVMPLGNFATLQRGADLAVQDRESGSIPVYGSNGILGTHAQPLRSGPGVITGRSGSIGKVYFADGPYWPLNTTLYVRDFHGHNERYAYWLLTSLRLDRYAASTGVPSLNRNFVHPKVIAVAPRNEQDNIAAVLDAVENTIRPHEIQRDVLLCLKASSTHDLLTGRTRSHKLFEVL